MRSAERIVARGSIRTGACADTKRRVRTLSSGSSSLASSFFATAISAADICAKSMRRSTSLPDVVKRASISISGISRCGRRSLRSPSKASPARVSPGFGFSFSRLSSAIGDIIAIIFCTRSRERQNSRKASSKTARSSCRLTKVEQSAA